VELLGRGNNGAVVFGAGEREEAELGVGGGNHEDGRGREVGHLCELGVRHLDLQRGGHNKPLSRILLRNTEATEHTHLHPKTTTETGQKKSVSKAVWRSDDRMDV
jgi:hypothetical protein